MRTKYFLAACVVSVQIVITFFTCINANRIRVFEESLTKPHPQFVFTQNDNCIYSIYIKPKGNNQLPEHIELPTFSSKINSVSVLGNSSVKIKISANSDSSNFYFRKLVFIIGYTPD